MPDDPTPKTEETPTQSDAQQRINSLIKKTSDQESQLEAIVRQNQALQQQLAATTERISQLETSPTPDAGSDPFADMFASATSGKAKRSQQTPSGKDLANFLESAVQKAIAPIVQKEEARQAEEQLRLQQQQAFQEALKLVPELAEEESEVSKAFNEILAGAPDLMQSPTGPKWAATTAAWAVAGARREEKNLDTLKRAANISRPSKGAPRDTEAFDSPEKVSALKEKLVEAGTQAGWSDEQANDYVALKLLEGQQAAQGKR